MRILCDGIMTLSIAAIPALQKQLFDLVTSQNGRIKSLSMIIMAYVISMLASVVFEYLSMIFTWKATLNFEQSLKRDFFKSIFNYSYEKFSSKDVGEYISIQGNDITALDQDYLTPLIDMVQAANKILIFGIFLFVNVDWKISTVILIGSTLTIAIPKISSKPDRKSTRLNS